MLPRVLDQIFKSSSKVQMNMYESKKKKTPKTSLSSFFLYLIIHSFFASRSVNRWPFSYHWDGKNCRKRVNPAGKTPGACWANQRAPKSAPRS